MSHLRDADGAMGHQENLEGALGRTELTCCIWGEKRVVGSGEFSTEMTSYRHE